MSMQLETNDGFRFTRNGREVSGLDPDFEFTEKEQMWFLKLNCTVHGGHK